jgi:plastocyanin
MSAARVAVALLATACSSAATSQPGGTPCFYDCTPERRAEACIYDCADGPVAAATPSVPFAPFVAPTGTLGPAGEKAAVLREAATQLDKAALALTRGNRRLAEQLFSTAELLAPDELAPLAATFRLGAPPRVTAPPVEVEAPAAPQPITVGNTDVEDRVEETPPKPEYGSLTGAILVDGRRASGAFGLVTLTPEAGGWKQRTPKHHVIEQRGREFRPRLMAISVGSDVAFPNYDPYFHNVFSRSPVSSFDLGLYKPNTARTYTFTNEGIVHLGCNLHANMSAFIVVVAAPAYVVTDERGEFTFHQLAPGRYTMRAWSERSAAPVTQAIAIKVGRNHVEIGVDGRAPRGAQPDKFGGAR